MPSLPPYGTLLSVYGTIKENQILRSSPQSLSLDALLRMHEACTTEKECRGDKSAEGVANHPSGSHRQIRIAKVASYAYAPLDRYRSHINVIALDPMEISDRAGGPCL